MFPCNTCKKRNLKCDLLKPRCSPCRHSHVKCAYDKPVRQIFEFKDETEHVTSSSGRCKKRTRTMSSTNASQQLTQRPLNREAETEVEYHDSGLMMPDSLPLLDNTGMPWMGDLLGSSLDQQQWGLDTDLDILWGSVPNPIAAENFQVESPDGPIRASEQLITGSIIPVQEYKDPILGSPSVVSDRVLAQHYTQNLTAKYTSKVKGWNNHTYFFNRFISSHQFVISSLYAWTAAHLFCNGTLSTGLNAIEYYNKSLAGLEDQLGIRLLAETGTEEDVQICRQLLKRDEEDLDAVTVTLYFLAWTDLLLSRKSSLRRMISLEASLLDLHGRAQPQSFFVRMAVWFCFLDARTCLFNQGNDRIIQSMGDDSGLMRAVEESHDFLQREYSLLYPEEARRWDEAHRPLYIATCRLVGLLGRISRSDGNASNLDHQLTIRETLDDIGRDLKRIDETKASENKVLSIYLTTNTLFHAVKIYASRMHESNEALYAGNTHAEKIITFTRDFYQKLKRPRTEAPPTKIWPIPLVMAAIESKDPIYREWALQKIRDCSHAGKHFVNACAFVEKVQAAEEATGCRSNLLSVAQEMGDDFVL